MHLAGFNDHNRLYNKASDRYYRMIEKDGAYFEQRFQIGFQGKETNREEMRIDYVVGSESYRVRLRERSHPPKYSVLLVHTGALDQAVDQAKDAVRLEPRSAATHVNLGIVYAKKGDTGAAEAEYRAALALETNDGEAYLKLADLLVKQAKWQEACKY